MSETERTPEPDEAPAPAAPADETPPTSTADEPASEEAVEDGEGEATP